MKEIHLEKESSNHRAMGAAGFRLSRFYIVPLWRAKSLLQHVMLIICGEGTSALSWKARLFMI